MHEAPASDTAPSLSVCLSFLCCCTSKPTNKQLAANADIYVNDAFGTAHRAHASTEGVTKFLKPSVSGFLLQKVRQILASIWTAARGRGFCITARGRLCDLKLWGCICLFQRLSSHTASGRRACCAGGKCLQRLGSSKLVPGQARTCPSV